jgi:hypothetical protein
MAKQLARLIFYLTMIAILSEATALYFMISEPGTCSTPSRLRLPIVQKGGSFNLTIALEQYDGLSISAEWAPTAMGSKAHRMARMPSQRWEAIP